MLDCIYILQDDTRSLQYVIHRIWRKGNEGIKSGQSWPCAHYKRVWGSEERDFIIIMLLPHVFLVWTYPIQATSSVNNVKHILTHCNTQPQSHCGTNVHVFFHEYLAVFISVQQESVRGYRLGAGRHVLGRRCAVYRRGLYHVHPDNWAIAHRGRGVHQCYQLLRLCLTTATSIISLRSSYLQLLFDL